MVPAEGEPKKILSLNQGGGGQNDIDDPINYGTFSFHKYKVQDTTSLPTHK